jgi:ATPase family associated with various cellular activities (AAA)
MFEKLVEMVKTRPITIVLANDLEGEFLWNAIQEIQKSLPDLEIENMEGIPSEIGMLRDRYHRLTGSHQRMVILEYSNDYEISRNLARLVSVYRHPYPSNLQIQALYLEHGIQDYNEQKISYGRGMSYPELDLTLKQARNAHDFWAYVKQCRDQKLELTGLRIESPPVIDKVAGLDKLLEILPSIRVRLSDRAREAGLKSPRGILLAGVPGTGKSLAAGVIAQELDLPMFSLPVDLICDKGVKELEKMLYLVEQMAPCALFIDEAEKIFSRSTDRQVMGFFLKWMQEHQSLVYCIGALNRLNDMPAEFKRTGRWDKIYSLTMPDPHELIAQFRLHLSRLDHRYLQEDFIPPHKWRMLASRAINFVAAEVHQVVYDVATELLVNDINAPVEIDIDRVIAHAKAFDRQYKRDGDEILNISQQADKFCTPAGGAIKVMEEENVDIWT